MTGLLCRIFIKDRNNITSPRVRCAYGMLVSIVGIFLNIMLASGKVIIGTVFGIISVTADGINNLADAGSQIVSLVSFRISAKPADRGHPFGHARIEYAASMIVSVIIVIVGWQLFTESIARIFESENGTSSISSPLLFSILGVSIAVKFWMFLFNRKIAARINSSVMKATATDSLSDVAATATVLVAAIISQLTGIATDAYIGTAVAVFIMWSGIKILSENMNSIIGMAPAAETVNAIRDVVHDHPDALGMHDLMVHSYGPGYTIATFHVEVDGYKNVFMMHDMIDTMEKELLSLHGIHATIHMDPIETDDRKVSELRQQAENTLNGIDNRLRLHDFRYVTGAGEIKLIFDVEAPYELKMSDSQLKNLIYSRLYELDSSYIGMITIDRI